MDFCPIAVVEKDVFENLLRVLEPGYRMQVCYLPSPVKVGEKREVKSERTSLSIANMQV